MKEEAYITANQVTYTYGKGKHKQGAPPFSLGPVNLELYQQEITFVVGANGSGKSTLGKLLTGIYPPQRGQVFIDGVNGKNLSLGQMGKKIGYLWQKPEMQLFASTPLEELAFIEELEGKPKETCVETALGWLSLFEIVHLKDAHTHTLSRGEKQRLALAAVMSRGAKFLILDEPTKGLDGVRKAAFENLLLKIHRQEGTGMMMISHDKSFTDKLAERVIVLEGGGIAHDLRS